MAPGFKFQALSLSDTWYRSLARAMILDNIHLLSKLVRYRSWEVSHRLDKNVSSQSRGQPQ